MRGRTNNNKIGYQIHFMTDGIDYPLLIDAAMRGVVKSALKDVKLHGLPGEHHFFVSFRTDAAGVGISDGLRARYPKEITIVMQHQFWDLKVEESYFSITLSFNNIPEKLTVPYAALTAFADPSVRFALQFNAEIEEAEVEAEAAKPAPRPKPKAKTKPASYDDGETTARDNPLKGADVISLDSFRKK